MTARAGGLWAEVASWSTAFAVVAAVVGGCGPVVTWWLGRRKEREQRTAEMRHLARYRAKLRWSRIAQQRESAARHG